MIGVASVRARHDQCVAGKEPPRFPRRSLHVEVVRERVERVHDVNAVPDDGEAGSGCHLVHVHPRSEDLYAGGGEDIPGGLARNLKLDLVLLLRRRRACCGDADRVEVGVPDHHLPGRRAARHIRRFRPQSQPGPIVSYRHTARVVVVHQEEVRPFLEGDVYPGRSGQDSGLGVVDLGVAVGHGVEAVEDAVFVLGWKVDPVLALEEGLVVQVVRLLCICRNRGAVGPPHGLVRYGAHVGR
mmetsp:Transcript_36784/g.68109  ORF Transcript_36784/g.68109 Transcript_36784/m.68109 type:complete len:241 (-) Transcript_36784:1996-2718(-)